MVVGVEFNKYKSKMYISYINKNKEIDFIIKNIPSSDLYNYEYCEENTGLKSWDNKNVRKKPTEYLGRFRQEEFLYNNLTLDEKNKMSEFNTPKKYYCDIETETGENNEFPEPSEAKYQVLLISVVNESNIAYILSCREDLRSQEQDMENEMNTYLKKSNPNLKTYTLKYLWFKTEIEMLEYFFHKFLPKIPLLTGWNFLNFDWQYLMKRCENLKINPTKNIATNKRVTKYLVPAHTAVIDYLELFRSRSPLKIVENYTLDYISKEVLGVKKFKNDNENILEMYKTNYRKFAIYNAIDSILVKEIEDSKFLLDVVFEMVNLSICDINKYNSPVFISEILIFRKYIEQNLKVPEKTEEEKQLIYNSKYQKNEGGPKYEGAFVKEPIPGYYKTVVCQDFSSLYPNIICSNNISPDTYLGKGLNLSIEELIDRKICKTAFDTYFRMDIDSVSRKILNYFYNERLENKALRKALSDRLNELDK